METTPGKPPMIWSASRYPALSVRFSDVQLAIFLLSTVHSLCLSNFAGSKIDTKRTSGRSGEEDSEEEEKLIVGRGGGEEQGRCTEGAARNCRVVHRFDSFGGGWGYSAHCVEAIQFRSSRDILFCGVGLFGGRGEYAASMKLFRVRTVAEAEPGDEHEKREDLLAETDQVLFECAPRETAVLQLERPIPVGAGRWHVVWVQIQWVLLIWTNELVQFPDRGPSSDCGAGGQAVVRVDVEDAGEEAEGSIEFHFRSHPLSSNGTNVEVGQIPELYFLPAASTSSSGLDASVPTSPVPRPSALFFPLAFPSACPSSIRPLLAISEWALRGVFHHPGDAEPGELVDCDALWRQERAALVALLAIRLIEMFVRTMPEGTKAEGELVEFYRMLKSTLERRNTVLGPEGQVRKTVSGRGGGGREDG